MIYSRNPLKAAVTTFTLFCVGALARAQEGQIDDRVLLRPEIAAQYQQSAGNMKSVGDSGEVCVPWSNFENAPTGNVEGGLRHCHTRISHPVHLGVKVVGERVVLPIAVGNIDTKIEGIVDTGSAGLTLDALKIFPANLVTSSGFNFGGEDQIRYKGITVTKLVATRSYGGQTANPTTRTGNLGFAHITLGEDGKVRTALIPILLVYTSTNQTNGAVVDFNNLIGINGVLAPIGSDVTFDGQPAPSESGSPNIECTLKSQSGCSLLSPLRAFSFADGVQTGYIFRSLPLVSGQHGDLTVGLDDRNARGFATTQLQCTTNSLEVQSCNQEVRNVHIVSSAGADFYWNVIFDSGRPDVGIVIPTNSVNPPSPVYLYPGTSFTVTPPTQTGYEYAFTTGTGIATTMRTYVNENASTAPQTFSNMGLLFFATNSLLLDYDKGIEGWEQASDSK